MDRQYSLIVRVSFALVLWLGNMGALHAQEPAAPEPGAREPSAHNLGSSQEVVVAATSIGGQALTLVELLRLATQNAPDLGVARAERSHAGAGRAAADPWMTQNPTLGIALGPRWRGSDVAFNGQVTLTHPLPLTGARSARRAVADAADARGDKAYALAMWSLQLAIHAGYRRARLAREYAGVALQLKEFFDGLVLTAQRRVAVGDLPGITLALAEADAARAAERVIATTQAYRMACLRLAATAGLSETRPPEPVGDTLRVERVPDLSALVALARENNPEMALRQAEVLEAEERSVLATRLARAVPRIGLQYGYEGAPEGGRGESVAMGTLSVPLAIYGRNQGNRATRRALRQVAEAQLDRTARRMLVLIEQYRTELVASLQRIESYGRDILPRFAANLRALERAFELGELGSTRVSVAAERFLRVQQRSLESRAAYSDALTNLERVIGTELSMENAQ